MFHNILCFQNTKNWIFYKYITYIIYRINIYWDYELKPSIMSFSWHLQIFIVSYLILIFFYLNNLILFSPSTRLFTLENGMTWSLKYNSFSSLFFIPITSINFNGELKVFKSHFPDKKVFLYYCTNNFFARLTSSLVNCLQSWD